MDELAKVIQARIWSGDGLARLSIEDCREIANAVRSFLLPEIEPLLKFHESWGHEGDGSDERIAKIRAALTAAIGEPSEFSGWVEIVDDDRSIGEGK